MKGGIYMVAKPRPMIVLGSDNKESFVQKFNSNLPSKEFRESCKKAGELFNVRKKTNR